MKFLSSLVIILCLPFSAQSAAWQISVFSNSGTVLGLDRYFPPGRFDPGPTCCMAAHALFYDKNNDLVLDTHELVFMSTRSDGWLHGVGETYSFEDYTVFDPKFFEYYVTLAGIEDPFAGIGEPATKPVAGGDTKEFNYSLNPGPEREASVSMSINPVTNKPWARGEFSIKDQFKFGRGSIRDIYVSDEDGVSFSGLVDLLFIKELDVILPGGIVQSATTEARLTYVPLAPTAALYAGALVLAALLGLRRRAG